jgi:SpoVK/Ycf46/Vps4 family AAA+-type ATPase
MAHPSSGPSNPSTTPAPASLSNLDKLISTLRQDRLERGVLTRGIARYTEFMDALQELKTTIGNDRLKDQIVDQVCFLLACPPEKRGSAMLNTVLYGNPGTGKTSIGKLLSRLWHALGVMRRKRNYAEEIMQQTNGTWLTDNPYWQRLTTMGLPLGIVLGFLLCVFVLLALAGEWYTLFMIFLLAVLILGAALYLDQTLSFRADTGEEPEAKATTSTTGTDEGFIVVSREHLVGEYIGHTVSKTTKLLEGSLNKVVFFDEAHSIATGPRDYGKEALSTINRFLSEHPTEIIAIFAGYEQDIKANLFQQEKGLERRVMWKLSTNDYTAEQLYQIFTIQLRKAGWELQDEQAVQQLFIKHHAAFRGQGGDTERLCRFAQELYSHDVVLNQAKPGKLRLTTEHIEAGIRRLNENSLPPEAGLGIGDLLGRLDQFQEFQQSQQLKLHS